MSNELVPYSEIQKMAADIVKGGLFPTIKTEAQAMTLFMIAQAENKHPMTALLEYDILPNGKPSLKNSAFLARFQERGGQIEVIHRGDDYCELVGYSKGLKTPVTVKWTAAESARAGLSGKMNHKQYPADMMYWRCVYRLVSIADPGAARSLYPSAVAQDFEEVQKALPAEIVAPEPPKAVQGPSVEETQLRKSLGETPEPVRLEGAVAPGHCTLKGCGGEIELFKSTQDRYKGREYWQCLVAHDERNRLLDEGATILLANAAVAAHYREWAGPWNAPSGDGDARPAVNRFPSGVPGSIPGRRTNEGAGEAVSDPAAELPPPLPEDAPAPSIFDPEAISKQVAKKIAREKVAK